MSGEANLAAVDARHLRLLSNAHYVLAGLTVLVGTVPVLELVLAAALVGSSSGGDEWYVSRLNPRATAVVGAAWIFGALLFFSGRALRRRNHRWYCELISAVSVLLVPVGSVLGICTLVVLCRPRVRAAFDQPRDLR